MEAKFVRALINIPPLLCRWSKMNMLDAVIMIAWFELYDSLNRTTNCFV